MLRHMILAVCFLFPWMAWSEVPSPSQKDVKVLEQKIGELQARLENLRLKEMDQDVQGQGLMIDDWEAYRKDVEQVRQSEQEENQIQREIEKLKQQKEQLRP